VTGLVGAIMRKPAQVDFPGNVEDKRNPVLDDLGGAGEPLEALEKTALEQVVGRGRVGLLVDVNGDDPKALPYVTTYTAANIISWQERVIAGRKQPVKVVLMETVEVTDPDDPHEVVCEERYRLLQLDDARRYTVEIWKKVKEEATPTMEAKEVWVQVGDTIEPAFRGGRKPDFIPFTFINPSSTTAACEKPPLLDLVNVNLSHYRNSADLEHGLHFTALPTAYMTGWDGDANELRIGSSRAWATTNPGATAGYLEFTGAGLSSIESQMDKKVNLMAVLGARLLEEQKKEAEAAETVKLRHAGSNSVLANIAMTVSEGLTRVLGWVAKWMGLPDDKVQLKLSTDYEVGGVDPTLLTAMMGAFQSGAISWLVWSHFLERHDVYPEGHTPEEEANQIAAGGPVNPAGQLAEESSDLDLKLKEKQLKEKPKPAGPPFKGA
jgi:hypothetical protein